MNKPVFGIPVSFSSEENVNVKETLNYCQYLKKNGASRLMTTAGTSTFNLLSKEEIHKINIEVSRLDCETFLGLPEMSLYHTQKMVEKCNYEYGSNSKILLLFPERFYCYEQIIKFFSTVAEISNFPIYIHGKTIRNATGGNYDYCHNVINELSSHPNIFGMKEEHPNLNKSFNEMLHFNKNFETIVAGGSMRRFMFLNNAGASTFLTGVGNILPSVALKFYEEICNGNLKTAKEIICKYESPLFNTFMKLGWHKALRNALHLMGFNYNYARSPFCYKLNKKEIKSIQISLDKIMDFKNGK